MTSNAATERKFAQVRQRIDPQAKLLRVWSLPGGVSAQVTAFEIQRPGGQTQKLVLRQHGAIDRTHNPRIAADEFRLLQRLSAQGLPVPQPIYLDKSGEIFPAPYLVQAFIDGAPQFAPPDMADFTCQLAAVLARIHQCSTAGLDFLPQQSQRVAARLSDPRAESDLAPDEARLRAALQAVWPLTAVNAPVLLHGDFWPGNLLWQADDLAAIIDWEDAALGDPLADLANARLEILWAFGEAAMRDFTRRYQALMSGLDLAHLPYWDLSAALRPLAELSHWGLDPAVEQRMRDQLIAFITQALHKLSL